MTVETRSATQEAGNQRLNTGIWLPGIPFRGSAPLSINQVDHARPCSSPVAVCNAGGRVDAFNLPFLHLTRRIMLSSSSLINPSYTESKQMSNGGTCIRESKSYASFNCSEENLSYERPFRQGTVGRWTARPASHPGDPRPGKHTPEILQPQLSPLADPLLHILYGL